MKKCIITKDGDDYKLNVDGHILPFKGNKNDVDYVAEIFTILDYEIIRINWDATPVAFEEVAVVPMKPPSGNSLLAFMDIKYEKN